MKKKDEIAAELNALHAAFGAHESGKPIFHTPEGYFREFPGQMLAVIQAMNADTSFEAPVPKDGPFDVPLGYFENLSSDIMARIRAADAVVLHNRCPWPEAAKQPAYTVPEGYFEHFSDNLMALIGAPVNAADELGSLSPLLAGMRDAQPFSVPEGYFGNEALAQKAKAQRQAPRTAEHPAVRSIKWARWAAAAAVVAIFALGGLHYFNPSVPGADTGNSFQQALAQVPEANLKEWLTNNLDEADINTMGSSIANTGKIRAQASLNRFSDQEIEDILETEVW